jgi:hypothetical protein
VEHKLERHFAQLLGIIMKSPRAMMAAFITHQGNAQTGCMSDATTESLLRAAKSLKRLNTSESLLGANGLLPVESYARGTLKS